MEHTGSLWWTSTYKAEGEVTLTVGGKGRNWEIPFVLVVDLLGYRFEEMGRACKGKRGH